MSKWEKINLPWFEIDEFADILVDKIPILTLLDKWGIEYSPCATGGFSHRLKCPLPAHLGGEERTASFFVSEEQNKFYCFGCNANGNVIDIVSLYTGRPYYEAMKWLAIFAGINSSDAKASLQNVPKKEKKDPEKINSTHVFRAGIIIRNSLNKIKDKKEYGRWCSWADKQFDILDEYLEMPNDKWESVKKGCEDIINYIKRELV